MPVVLTPRRKRVAGHHQSRHRPGAARYIPHGIVSRSRRMSIDNLDSTIYTPMDSPMSYRSPTLKRAPGKPLFPRSLYFQRCLLAQHSPQGQFPFHFISFVLHVISKFLFPGVLYLSQRHRHSLPHIEQGKIRIGIPRFSRPHGSKYAVSTASEGSDR